MVLKNIGHVEGGGNLPISWQINDISIITNFLLDRERTEFLGLELAIGANREAFAAQMNHNQIPWRKDFLTAVLVSSGFVMGIGGLQMLMDVLVCLNNRLS
ncbi:hypothetical protein PanWU01x14_097930 [Parasponia andersonii]|uniref:Uncharacterized protein n=1 Tax=Parasponia andersonii TaxID=3476 RepID=A0A2P5D4J7_PARAD|nr:hypothetical protein PanWU01x14_097930 [Parasponia andersonii]